METLDSFLTLSTDELADILKQVMSAAGVLLALSVAFLAYFSGRSKDAQRKDSGEVVEINARQLRISRFSVRAGSLSVSAVFSYFASLVLAFGDLIYLHLRQVNFITDLVGTIALLTLAIGIVFLFRLVVALRWLLKQPEQDGA